MNQTDEIPYALAPNGCRYYVEDAEHDRRAEIKQHNQCAACLKLILFILGFYKPRADLHVASHFKHRPGDLETCIGYVQLRKSTSCVTSLIENSKKANKEFVLECESFNCVQIVPPPYIIAFDEANVTYHEALQYREGLNDIYGDASDSAIKNKTFRIKANKNCPLFNNSRCQSCEAEKCLRDLAAQTALVQRLEAEKEREVVRVAATQRALVQRSLLQRLAETEPCAIELDDGTYREAMCKAAAVGQSVLTQCLAEKKQEAMHEAVAQCALAPGLVPETKPAVESASVKKAQDKKRKADNDQRLRKETRDQQYGQIDADYPQAEVRFALFNQGSIELTNTELHLLRNQVCGFTGKKTKSGDVDIFPPDARYSGPVLESRKTYRKLLYKSVNPTPCIGCGTPQNRSVALYPFDTNTPYLLCNKCS